MAGQGEQPKALESRVSVRADLLLYWRAFFDLSTCRSSGLERGAIPWMAMDAWAKRVGLNGDAFERFVSAIRVMDGAYLKYWDEQSD